MRWVGWLSKPGFPAPSTRSPALGAITQPHLIHLHPAAFSNLTSTPPQPAARTLGGSGAQAEGQKAVLSQEEEPGSSLLTGSAMR